MERIRPVQQTLKDTFYNIPEAEVVVLSLNKFGIRFFYYYFYYYYYYNESQRPEI